MAGQIKYSQKIFLQDQGGPNGDGIWWQIEDERLDFSKSQTITIGMSVFAFSESKPMTVTRIDRSKDKTNFTMRSLPSVPCNQMLEKFSLTLIQEKYILLAGGQDER